MLYLLTTDWEWFAVALFIGLAVGWLTTTRERNTFSGHGPVVTAFFALAGGFLLSNLQTIPGRAGLFLEIGLLIASAYAVGLPIGGGFKLLLLGQTAAAPARKKQPPIVVVRGKPALDAMPAAAIDNVTPAAAVETALPPVIAPTPIPTPAPRTEPAKRAAPAPAVSNAQVDASKKTPGLKPEGLPGPRGGKPDDLSKIKGVGPKSVDKLQALGVYHFDQIAAWTPENIKWISASLAIPGRIERGRWVAQAKEFAASNQTVAAEADDVSAPAQ